MCVFVCASKPTGVDVKKIVNVSKCKRFTHFYYQCQCQHTWITNDRCFLRVLSIALSLYSFASAHCAHTQTKLNKLKICIYQTWTDSGNGIAVNNKQTKATTKNRLKWRISHDTKHNKQCLQRSIEIYVINAVSVCFSRTPFVRACFVPHLMSHIHTFARYALGWQERRSAHSSADFTLASFLLT